MQYLLVFFFVLVLPVFCLARANPWKDLEDHRGVSVSAFVYDITQGKGLSSWKPNQRLTPASVSKLAVAAQALETWGEDKAFTSSLYTRGTLNKGVLRGDLVFYGGGDPYLTNEKLWYLTTDAARTGLRTVTGNLVVNTSFFGSLEQDPARSPRTQKSRHAYDSPLSSAAVNFSVAGIVVSPSTEKTEKQARVSLEPYALPHVRIVNKTSMGPGPTRIEVQRISAQGIDTFVVSGHMAPQAATVRVYRSVSQAEFYAGEVVKAFLEHANISVLGHIVIQSDLLLPTDRTLASIQGFPLSWQLRGLLEQSNNFIADMLLLHLGKISGASKKLSSYATSLQDYMTNIVTHSPLVSGDFSTQGLVVDSGSGLTPSNKMSALDIVAMLEHMYTQPRFFPAYLAALPQPQGEGSLHRRFQDAPENLQLALRAKTGTLTEPVDVVSLAGYCRSGNGGWISFAILLNGKQKHQSIAALREDLDATLAKVLLPYL